jgi:hypothetical protein
MLINSFMISANLIRIVLILPGTCSIYTWYAFH